MSNNSKIIKIGNLMYQNQPFVKRYTWDEAVKYAKNLRLGNYDNWRLPTIEELEKIRNQTLNRDAFVRKEFVKNMPEFSFFWSSSKYENKENYTFFKGLMLAEYFNGARYTNLTKENQEFVMCVRKI